MRIAPYLVLFLLARALAGLCAILPWSLERPFRWCELRLLYFIRHAGPGGFDDAVQTTLMRNANTYAGPVIRMLMNSRPGSVDERIAISFVEAVRGPPDVDNALMRFGNGHPDTRTRSLISRILAHPPHEGAASVQRIDI